MSSHYEKLNGIERCIDDEIQFDIPDNWCWCRLGSVVEKLTDGTHKTPKYQPSGVPFLSVKDISSGKYHLMIANMFRKRNIMNYIIVVIQNSAICY